ncbi:MAG: carbohydrate ABC transporter permease, partial [Dermatophilaceae bacterium]
MLGTKRSASSKWLLYTVVTLGFLAVITPFVWMVLGSFKPEGELLRVPPTWWPESPTLDNYRELFSKGIFPRSFFNSTIVAIVVTVANVTFCSMVGYALAKLRFRGKKVVFGLVMGTLMIPGMVTFVPLFVL